MKPVLTLALSTLLILLTDITNNCVDAYSVLISQNVSCKLKVGVYYRTLDCSDRGLTEVPNFASAKALQYDNAHEHIHVIDLSGNQLTRLEMRPLNFFVNLRQLNVSRNNLVEMTIKDDSNLPQFIESLDLDDNEFTEIPVASLRRFENLETFSMRRNRFTRIRNDTFLGLDRLHTIRLFKEEMKSVYGNPGKLPRYITPDIGAFRHMRSLKELDLLSVELKLEQFPDLTGTNNLKMLYIADIKNMDIPASFCEQQKRLHTILIWKCSGGVMPSLSKCRTLEMIDLAVNTFHSIGNESISGLPRLQTLKIDQYSSFPHIHPDAFNDLPKLRKLDLSDYSLQTFPNLRGARSLIELNMENTGIKTIPEHLCWNAPNLVTVHLMRNDLQTLPSFSKCTKLDTLNLHQNRIKDLTTQFRGLTNLEYLSLNDNLLAYIPESLLGSCKSLKFLYLADNKIREIHTNGFVNNTQLASLDVSNNFLKKLPSNGLQSLKEIKAIGNPDMITFPTQQDLPHARKLKVHHAYHCCFFLRRVQQIKDWNAEKMSGKSKWNTTDEHDLNNYKGSPIVDNFFNKNTNATVVDDDVDPLLQLLRKLNNNTKIFIPVAKADHEEQESMSEFFDDEEPYCTPTPNEFYPCEDLMGRDWLRICVWIVFLLAVFGNATVLFVMFSNYSKLDVPRFLVLNLSVADLLLGVYLGFLAFVDIKTIGDFRSHALEWQFSGMCQLAGFIAVFSSELSVFTLTAITMERFLTIKNCMYVEKRFSKTQIYMIMAFGWFFAAFVAILPVIKIGDIQFNDYSKYSVCLPFETGTLASQTYLSAILCLNLLAFVIILFCYVKIYLFIRNSHAWNSGDSLVARRVAILVFTDFLCWFPIAIIALSTVLGKPMIHDLWVSKVITVFVFPLNACANPFLYAITKKRFRKDIVSATRRLKEKLSNNGEIRKSLLRLPIKGGSLTYSTSVRRESSCSFLFSRRHSAKQDANNDSSRQTSRQQTPILQQSTQQSNCDEHDEDDFQERLTTV